MTNSSGLPPQEKICRALQDARSSQRIAYLARPRVVEIGQVWDADCADGGWIPVLITESYDKGPESPFSFCRALPLGIFFQLTAERDVMISVGEKSWPFVAHCWLEGPLLHDQLINFIGQVAPPDLELVLSCRGTVTTVEEDEDVAAYRTELIELVAPSFLSSWHRVAELDKSQPTEAEIVRSEDSATPSEHDLAGLLQPAGASTSYVVRSARPDSDSLSVYEYAAALREAGYPDPAQPPRFFAAEEAEALIKRLQKILPGSHWTIAEEGAQ